MFTLVCDMNIFKRIHKIDNSINFDHLDIDECTTESPCHANATCNNTEGSYICECNTGFNGNGLTCEGKFFLIKMSNIRFPVSTLLNEIHISK